ENGMDFIRRAEDILGVPVRVLSGREEAQYSGRGIISAFHRPDGIAGDLGGGSLEVVEIAGETIGDSITLPLGGLRLQDMAKGSPAAAAKLARAELRRAAFLAEGRGRTFYCVG